MQVTSPVGDFPFTPRRLRLEGTSIVLEGAMGAWPATVRVGLRDIPELARLVPTFLYAIAGTAAVALLAAILLRR
jgi:hypothetical protein